MNGTSAREEDQGDGAQPSPSLEGAGPRARLTRLRINRFRQVKPGTELRVDEGINVLLGRNGTGKTTLLDLICALVSGNLGEYQSEDFDLEYEIVLEELRFSVRAQNHFPESEGKAEHLLGHRRSSGSWAYEVTASTLSGESYSAKVTSKGALITGPESRSSPVEIRAMSMFAVGFYVLQFVFIGVELSGHIPDQLLGPSLEQLAVINSCFRLDEGVDVFKRMVAGEPLPLVVEPLSVDVISGSSEGGEEMDFYAPSSLRKGIVALAPSLDEATSITLDHEHLDFLRTLANILRVSRIKLTMSLKQRRETSDGSGIVRSTFWKPIFSITNSTGTTFTHEGLSFGEKRLLAFLYHAAANPEIVVADELVNGLHHEWIQVCLDAIQGQAFLTSQNPLLLDHLPFSSAEEVKARFVLCDSDAQGQWTWRNMDDDAAEAFFRAYEVGIQHVSEILETSGLW